MQRVKQAIIVCIYGFLLMSHVVNAEIFKIGFISTEAPEAARVKTLISKELTPLIKDSTKIEFISYIASPSAQSFQEQINKAHNDATIQAIVIPDVLGSQFVYNHQSFAKPTFLSWVMNPSFVGSELKTNTPNLYWISTRNNIDATFKSIVQTIGAKPITLVMDEATAQLGDSFFQALQRNAAKFSLPLSVTLLNPTKPINSQIEPDIALALVPPMGHSTKEIIEQIQANNIPVFSFEGSKTVEAGAMMTDVVDANEFLIARQIALDIYSLFQQDPIALGPRWLASEHHLTFNISAARRMGIDLPIDAISEATAVGIANRDVDSISLEDILQWTLEKNTAVAQANNNIALADESITQARSALLPQLSTSFSHTRNTQGGNTVSTGSPHHNTRASINVSHVLYSEAARNNYDVAQLNKQSQQYVNQASQQSAVANALHAFLQVLIAEANLEAQQENVHLARANLLMAKKRAKLGSGTTGDVYNLESSIATANSNLLAARISTLEARRQLMDLSNTKFDVNAVLDDVNLDHPSVASSYQLVQPLLETLGGIQKLSVWSAEQSVNDSPDLQASVLSMDIHRLQLHTAEKAIFSPEVSLTGQAYHYIDSATGSSGNSLDNVNDASLSINLTWPLWSGGQSTSLVRQANHQLTHAELNYTASKNAVEVAAKNATFKLAQAWRDIQLGAIALASAEKSLQINQQAYTSGALTIDALQTTQNIYISALSTSKSNMYRYIQALSQWQLQVAAVNYLMSAQAIQQWSVEANDQITQLSLQ